MITMPSAGGFGQGELIGLSAFRRIAIPNYLGTLRANKD